MNPPTLLVVILRLVWIYVGWCALSFCFSCFSCFFKRDLCSAIFWLCRMLVCMSFVSTVLTIVLLFFLCPRWCSETSCALQWFLAVCCVFPPLFCSIVATLLLFLLQAFYVQHFSRDNFWCCDALFVCSAPFFLWLFTKISLPCIARCWFSPLWLFWLFFCLVCWNYELWLCFLLDLPFCTHPNTITRGHQCIILSPLPSPCSNTFIRACRSQCAPQNTWHVTPVSLHGHLLFLAFRARAIHTKHAPLHVPLPFSVFRLCPITTTHHAIPIHAHLCPSVSFHMHPCFCMDWYLLIFNWFL